MRAVVWPVKGAARICEIDGDDLGALQLIVGGPIQPVNVGGGLIAICNEDGKMLGLRPCGMMIMHHDGSMDTLVGDIILCRSAGDRFSSLEQNDLDVIAAAVLSAGGMVTR